MTSWAVRINRWVANGAMIVIALAGVVEGDPLIVVVGVLGLVLLFAVRRFFERRQKHREAG